MDGPIYDGWTAANVISIGFPSYMSGPFETLAAAALSVGVLVLLLIVAFRMICKSLNRAIGR